MKQFSIQTLFGFMTLAATVCGIFYWFGPNAPAAFMALCLVPGPLAGSIVRICWSDASDLMTKFIQGGVYGGMAGYLAACILLAWDAAASLSGSIWMIPTNHLWEIAGLLLFAWFVGLVISFTYGGIAGIVIAAGWFSIERLIAIAAPKKRSAE